MTARDADNIAHFRRIAFALSTVFHEDPRMPRVCPFCNPNAKAPYFSAICPDHAGVA